MPSHKSNDYKLTAVQYYLVEDKTQEEVCKIFKCIPRSLMRWEYVKFLVDEINKNKTITLHELNQKLKDKYKHANLSTTQIFRVNIENPRNIENKISKRV